jgi:phosphodiesterase/alkaline phosphatase D-like protein
MEEELGGVLSQLASHVESVAGGDEKMIMSAGMNVRSAPTTSDLDAPESLTPTMGDRDGEVDLQWDKVNRARSYVIERSPDPPTATSWSHAATSTKSQVTVDGLTSGTKYWFRVAAVGANGQSPWSNPVSKVAP